MVPTSTLSPRPAPLRRLAAALAIVVLSGTALALPPTRTAADALNLGPKPMEAPEVSASVTAATTGAFLTPDEAKNLRIFHGLAEDADLDTPARIAADALLRSRFSDPVFADESVPALDRAQALLARGDAPAALALTGDLDSLRAVSIRVRALHDLGRADEAVKAAAPALALVSRGRAEHPLDAAWAVEAASIIAHIKPEEGGSDYRAMLALLRHAREQLDPLAWPVQLAEARLLVEKDNPAQAQEILGQVLSLCPASAGAWRQLGEMAVASFDMPSVEAIAARLDVIRGGKPGQSDSPDACALRCRAMLRQSEPALAQEALAPALATLPASRDLRALEAAAIAITFDPKRLDEALAAFEALSPGSARALHEAGKALSESRQYTAGAALLRRAIARQPNWVEPKIDLGLLLVQAGEDEAARDVLEDAARFDPFHVRAANSLTLVKSIAGFARLESEHFIVRYQPGRTADNQPLETDEDPDALVAREMLPVLEENHRRVASAPETAPGGLDHNPPRKTTVDLMPNHRSFAVRIAGMPKIHTIAASTGPVIAMEAPREGASHSGTYDWPRVVRHEYTHTVGLDKTNNRIPHWFTEAQAVYLEQQPRDEQTCRLLAMVLERDRLFDFSEINIAFVRPKKATDRQQGYAQGHWMYQYMVDTFGPRAPLALMAEYAAGIHEEAAYQKVLGIPRDEFLKRFKVWARQQVVSWGLLPKPGEPTVAELLKALTPATPPAPAAGPDAADAAAGDDGHPGEPGADGAGGAGKHAAPPEVPQPVLEQWLTDHPTHPDVLELALDRALSANNSDPTPDMVPLIDRYAAARPIDPKPHRLIARLALAPNASAALAARAVAALEFLDEREEKLPAFAAQLAELYAQEGNLPLAIAKADRATRISPYDARLRELAARVALFAKEPGAARRHIQMLVALEPGQPIHRRRLEAVKKLVQ